MKKNSFIAIGLLLVAAWFTFTNQSLEKEVAFNQAWAGKSVDLTQILGKNMNIACDEDRLSLTIRYNPVNQYNEIKNQYGDTLLYGRVVQYEKLYVVSMPTLSGLFDISAIDIQHDCITGLKTARKQMDALANSVKVGQYPELRCKTCTNPSALNVNEAVLYGFYQKFLNQSPRYFYEESPHESKTLLLQ